MQKTAIEKNKNSYFIAKEEIEWQKLKISKNAVGNIRQNKNKLIIEIANIDKKTSLDIDSFFNKHKTELAILSLKEARSFLSDNKGSLLLNDSARTYYDENILHENSENSSQQNSKRLNTEAFYTNSQPLLVLDEEEKEKTLDKFSKFSYLHTSKDDIDLFQRSEDSKRFYIKAVDTDKYLNDKYLFSFDEIRVDNKKHEYVVKKQIKNVFKIADENIWNEPQREHIVLNELDTIKFDPANPNGMFQAIKSSTAQGRDLIALPAKEENNLDFLQNVSNLKQHHETLLNNLIKNGTLQNNIELFAGNVSIGSSRNGESYDNLLQFTNKFYDILQSFFQNPLGF